MCPFVNNYGWMCLNAGDCIWMRLNAVDYGWICLREGYCVWICLIAGDYGWMCLIADDRGSDVS